MAKLKEAEVKTPKIKMMDNEQVQNSRGIRSSVILAFVFMALSTLLSNGAMAADPEKPVAQLTRTASSGLILSTALTKNIMKQVPYQDNYTVEVPYQAEETYVESVPYQATESYLDYETYYESEYRCHNVPGTRRECRPEQICNNVGGGRQCSNEQVCNDVGGGQNCQDVQECGTSATGQRICKTRRVCTNNPNRRECHLEQRCYDVPGRRECHNEERCYNVPDNRQECGYEQVLKSRPVTKYRTVTKYRDETRTRTVTKYRTETRCCVTRYREELDHQQTLTVEVQFPQGAELSANEIEVFSVELRGDEAQPSAVFSIRDSVYGYRVKDQVLTGNTYQIRLELVPKYSEAEVGVSTVDGLSLEFSGGRVALIFRDLGQKIRVTSSYQVQVLNQQGVMLADVNKTLIGSRELNSQVEIPMGISISENDNYQIRMHVQRSGPVLSRPVEFNVQGQYLAEQMSNAAIYMDPAQLTNLDLLGSGLSSRLYVADHAPLSSLVKTAYKITLQVVTPTGLQPLGVATIDRSSLSVDGEGMMQVSLVRDMQIAADRVQSAVTRSAQIQVDIEIQRQGPRLNHGKLVVLKRSFVDKNRD